MSTIIIGIGAPGSGKSTVLKNYADKEGMVYVCPDEIREELHGDAGSQENPAAVFALADIRVKKALKEGKSVVFDATNTVKFWRIKLVEKFRTFKKEDLFIKGVFINTPDDILRERNSNRERIVPDSVIENMLVNLRKEPPSVQDGFDSLSILDKNGELVELHKSDPNRENGIIIIKSEKPESDLGLEIKMK